MTRLDELLATPPAERPRKGPRRWGKSTGPSPARAQWARARGVGLSVHVWPFGWTAYWAGGVGRRPFIKVSARDPLLMDLERKPHTQRWRSEVVAWCRQMGEVKLP